MNFDQPVRLACALRDQGLVDLYAARLILALPDLTERPRPIRWAHAAVAKLQQATEKLFKGFFLYVDPSFDPTKGHTPLTDSMPNQRNRPFVSDLIIQLNRSSPSLIKELKLLEACAPSPPQDVDRSRPVSLNDVTRNTEYPFWSDAKSDLVTPAEDFTVTEAIRGLRAVLALARTMAQSEPSGFGRDIYSFLNSNPVDVPQ